MECENKMTCGHCLGAQYVLAGWLGKSLRQRGAQISTIPADLLKIIPAQYFIYCHCNPRVVLLNRKFTSCTECDGTTWKFSEFAEHKGYGYFGKKIRKVYWQKIAQLPSHYFERCSCGVESNSREVKELLEVVLECLDSPALS